MELIRSVAWLHVENGKVLCVRTKGKDKFYIPGGKIDQGESAKAALIREIQEELGVSLDENSIVPATTIVAAAHGFSSDQKVEMQCFYAQYRGVIAKHSEIEEIRWVQDDFPLICAPAAQMAITFLAQLDKISVGQV
ncbi:NUDIX hydrolase [Marinomonas sp. CT5]|uniref:NUDIX hydrolase n=1 Tax=Marinomonas sp. CT5 TaxID=2066133 RepID=UPI00183D3708|nr:NUDIX domain-containing protein [Marinomonas sp. CT5]NVK75966.1 NUDIX domain-containing protein [Oceanospirillaceae bacterium]QUX95589.1 NUDIX hydrolase [Marinomonas sp. CT5]